MGKHSCPTVQVEDGNGSYIVINESDFDKDKHKKFSSKPVVKKVEKVEKKSK